MTVTISQIEIDSSNSRPTARFIQEWSNGRFRDIGEKKLEFVFEGGLLMITREEMLSSTVLDPSQKEPE